MNNKYIIPTFADLVTLLYHEGRNVRHLIEGGKLSDDTKFLSLRDGLARNRDEAWKQIQPLRQKAADAWSSREVLRVFERKFELNLDDMLSLFGHSSWRGTRRGGNAWLRIARTVKEVSDLLGSNREFEANSLMSQILGMCHNTGKVSEKLKNLDNC